MSITDDIKKQVRFHRDKHLFYLSPLMPGDHTIRTLIVSKEVRDAVAPPWPKYHDGCKMADFRANLDAFTRGDWLHVSETPDYKPFYADMARVDPVADEIWDFRCVNPTAHIRCFGCFGGKDLFVALTWEYRDDLEWDDEIERCKKVWTNLFDPIPRYQGDTLDDYISNYYAL